MDDARVGNPVNSVLLSDSFLILLLLKITITTEQPRRPTVDGASLQWDFMPAMTCEQTAWITFPAEVFERQTLCSIVLDLCTQRKQTQTDMLAFCFPRRRHCF